MALKKKWAPVFGAIFIIASFLCLRDMPYLTGQKLFFHDSLISSNSMHLFFDAIFNGRLPLWSPEINSGEPLWTEAELMAAFDPVAFVIWGITFLFKGPSLLAFQWTATFWLIGFSIGGMLCSRRLVRNWPLNLVTLSILFGGSFAQIIRSQSFGFLIPFRYTPFVLLAFFRLEERPGLMRALALGVVAAMSCGGYQTPYSVFFLFLFVLIYLMASKVVEGRIDLKNARYYFLSLFTAVVGSACTIVSIYEMVSLYPAARVFEPKGYSVPTELFWHTFLAGPLSGPSGPWHGSAFVGWLPAFLIFSAYLLACFKWGNRKRSLIPSVDVMYQEKIEIAWLLTTVICTFLCIGGSNSAGNEHYFFGLRNWGFILTIVLLCFSQVSCIGFTLLERVSIDRKVIISLGLSIIVGYCFFVFRDCYSTRAKLRLLSTLFFYASAGVTYHLLLKRKATKVVPMLILVVVFLDLIQFSSRYSFFLKNEAKVTSRLPHLGSTSVNFVSNRAWKFDYLATFPFHNQGPSIIHKAYATMTPIVSEIPKEFEVTAFGPTTHQFRLVRYHELITSGLSDPLLKSILGVSSPVLRLVSNGIYVPNERSAFEHLRSLQTSPDLNREIIIEGRGSAVGTLIRAPSPPGTFSLLEFRQDLLKAHVSMRHDGYLVYADNYAPHWNVYVDGEPKELLAVNVTNKSVLVPKGEHEVIFNYEPISYVATFWMRVCFFATAFFVFCFVAIKQRVGTRRLNYESHSSKVKLAA